VIDVDILLFGDQQVRQRDLVIPHPRISERQFVLQSLDELGVSLGARS
jgi:2-amino-4-hydroxy-6-hydroxymethyldihydropteridine diphosphokinase